MGVTIYGLLFVADSGRHSSNPQGSPNLKGTAGGAAEIYLANAITLSRSLAALGHHLTVITNDGPRLRAIDRDKFHGPNIDIQEIGFDLQVPRGIAYYSAHHKFDVFRWFVTGEAGQYPVLIDLDCVALAKPSAQFAACAEAGVPQVYDISDHIVRLFGLQRIWSDISRLTQLPRPTAHWYGGEFIAGPVSFYATLCDWVDRLWPRYVALYETFHHQGDEMVLSAALASIQAQGLVLHDVGPIGDFARFGSWLPLHPQKPFWWFEGCSFLHLPNDKLFLASQAEAQSSFRAEVFLQAYRRYLFMRRAKGAAWVLAKVALRRRKRFSARQEAKRIAEAQISAHLI